MCSVLMKFKKISQKGIKSEKKIEEKNSYVSEKKRKKKWKKSQKHLQKEKIE